MAVNPTASVKLVIAGAPQTGKTSLLGWFNGVDFDPVYSPTLGSDFTVKEMECNNETVSVQIWDIGGSGVMSKSFLRGTQGLILVADVTAMITMEILDNLYDKIKSLAGFMDDNFPCAIVANKIDLIDLDGREIGCDDMIAWAKIRRPFPTDSKANHLPIAIFETSSITGHNIPQLFESVVTMIRNVPASAASQSSPSSSPSSLQHTDSIAKQHAVSFQSSSPPISPGHNTNNSLALRSQLSPDKESSSSSNPNNSSSNPLLSPIFSVASSTKYSEVNSHEKFVITPSHNIDHLAHLQSAGHETAEEDEDEDDYEDEEDEEDDEDYDTRDDPNSSGVLGRDASGSTVAKVIVAGAAGCGKTSVLSRFIAGDGKDIAPLQSYEPTIGADFRLIDMPVHGHTLKLQMWDSAGGDKMMMAISRSIYKDADCLVLVYDITSQDSFLALDKYWNNYLTYSNPFEPDEFPALLVGNKSDLSDKRAVTLETVFDWCMAKRPRKPITYVECSAKHSIGVNDVFVFISDAIYDYALRIDASATGVSDEIGSQHSSEGEESDCTRDTIPSNHQYDDCQLSVIATPAEPDDHQYQYQQQYAHHTADGHMINYNNNSNNNNNNNNYSNNYGNNNGPVGAYGQGHDLQGRPTRWVDEQGYEQHLHGHRGRAKDGTVSTAVNGGSRIDSETSCWFNIK